MKNQINRLIAVTGFAGDSMAAISCFQKVPFNIVFGQYRDKSAQEALIKDPTLDWTIVRSVS